MQNKQNTQKICHRDELGFLLNDCHLAGEGAEIGVFRGEYSLTLLSTWQGKTLHLVDPWCYLEGYHDGCLASDAENEIRMSETQERLKYYIGRYQIHRRTSVDAAQEFENGSLDFVYVDANHEYEHIVQDLKTWLPKIRQGGILSGHDFFDGTNVNGIYGVKSAVEEFAQRHQLSFSLTQDDPASWYMFV